MRPPIGPANGWSEPEDARGVPSLELVQGASDPLRPVRASATAGQLTADAYERHAGEIHAFLLRTVRDPEAAADLVADTFTKLLIEERAGRPPLLPRPWLYRVAANLATSRGRRLQVAMKHSFKLQRQAKPDDTPSAERAFLDRERSSDLWRALGRISPLERSALLLAAQGYEGTTIAEMIGRSPAATRTMMCRARRRLRVALTEADVR